LLSHAEPSKPPGCPSSGALCPVGWTRAACSHHYSVDAKRVDEFMRRVDEKFAPRLEKMPGFLAYQAIDAGVDRAGEGTVFAVTICSDREVADRSAEVAAEFVRDELGDMEVELFEAATGAVSVNRAMSEVLEAAHA
jgi:hypothetical protein